MSGGVSRQRHCIDSSLLDLRCVRSYHTIYCISTHVNKNRCYKPMRKHIAIFQYDKITYEEITQYT